VSITAMSLSVTSQPTGRPDAAAFGPLTRSVQSPLLSSFQRPEGVFFTIRPTAGGGGFAPLIGGSKATPLFGGGFCPP
jgi:hypothetical protein